MNIEIPDTVQFFVQPNEENDYKYVQLCFRHAVIAVTERNEAIRIELSDYCYCDVCG
jgi:hypothetical protein